MKLSYIHVKEDNKSTIIKYFICLIPLILYGIYKNGILLYQKDYISFLDIFKPLYLIIISLIINGIVEFIFNKKIELNFSYLNLTILSLFIMPSVNIFVYFIVLFLGLVITKILENKITFNKIALIKLLMIIVIAIMGKYTYNNIAEANNIYSYSLFDTICGRNIGGIASTNILFGLIIYAILSIFTNYKKSIPICSYLVYVICSLLIMLIFKDFDYNILFSSSVILSFILVATDTLSSPYTDLGQIIYSILLGITTSIFSLWLPFESSFISILLLSIFVNIIDRLAKKIKKRKSKLD